MTNLKELPEDHVLRNTPLIRINAQYLDVGSKVWNRVGPKFGIANKTYNQLKCVWTDNSTWQADETSI